MPYKSVRSAILASATLACISPAIAQQIGLAPPQFSTVDQNGINLTTGGIFVPSVGVAIGPTGDAKLSSNPTPISAGMHGVINSDYGPYSYEDGGCIVEGQPTYTVYVDGDYEAFTDSMDYGDCSWRPDFGPGDKGGTLNTDSSNRYVYTRSDGMIAYFSKDIADETPGSGRGTMEIYGTPGANRGRVTAIVYPNGKRLDFRYKSSIIRNPSYYVHRLQSISSNYGYMLKYGYEQVSLTPLDYAGLIKWVNITSITAVNLAQQYCDPVADACPNGSSWRSVQYSRPSNGSLERHALDSSGATTVFGYRAQANNLARDLLTVKFPGSLSADKTYTYATSSSVPGGVLPISQVSTPGGNWTYSYSQATDSACISNRCLITQRTDPAGQVYVFKSVLRPNSYGAYDITGKIARFKDENLREKIVVYENYLTSAINPYRVKSVKMPEGNEDIYSYDGRNNITGIQTKAKPSSGLPDIVQSAVYPSSCASLIYCNKPTSITDGRGNQTSYSYSTVHGGVLTETGPADANGVRPQVRSEYAQRYAWVKASNGSYVQAATPIWLKIKDEFCRTTAATGGNCAGGAADEVVTEYDYGPNSGPNNLSVRGVAVTSEGQTLRTCYSYDKFGNRISETKPAANLSTCP